MCRDAFAGFLAIDYFVVTAKNNKVIESIQIPIMKNQIPAPPPAWMFSRPQNAIPWIEWVVGMEISAFPAVLREIEP